MQTQGVLNVWHLVHYQRFYNSLVAQLVPTAEQASQSLVARVRGTKAWVFRPCARCGLESACGDAN